MEFRIGFKSSFDLLQNSFGFILKRKGKQKKGNKVRINSNQIKAHKRNSTLDLKLYVIHVIIQLHLV